MAKNRPGIRFLLLLLGISNIVGCGHRSASRQAGGEGGRSDRKVVLFAAASTTSALEEISRRFRREHGIVVEANYASSSTLAQQIENGAGADVFVSANENWADYLEGMGLVEKRQSVFGNRLVVIQPADAAENIGRPQDLLADWVKHLALGDPEAAPAGIYAKQALEALGLWEQLRRKVVAAPDVRHALSFVEMGAAEAGIVYATDAAISGRVKVALELAPELTDAIRYPVVLVKSGAENQAAESFYQYLSSAGAAEVFRKHGFTVLAAPRGCPATPLP